MQGKKICLNRNNKQIRANKSINQKHSNIRRTVDKNIIILSLEMLECLFQDTSLSGSLFQIRIQIRKLHMAGNKIKG